MLLASTLRLAARRRRFLVEWGVVVAASILLLATLVFSHGAARLDNIAYDALTRLAPAKASRDIVIVAIDNDSLAALGRWPWPRERHAAVVERLADAGARQVAYDVLFPEAAPDPAADQALAAAMGRTRVFLPVLLEAPGRDGRAVDVSLPAPPLARAAAGLGHVNLDFDTDGVVRRAYLRETAAGQVFPQLVVAAAGPPGKASMQPASDGLVRSDEVLVPFAPAGAFVTVPFAAVLRGEVPGEVFRGRSVLVGATAGGLHDHYETPARDAGGMPGVEIQANLLNAALSGALRRAAPDLAVLAVSLTALLAVLTGFLALSPRQGLVLLGGVAAGLIMVSALLLLAGRIWLPPVAGLITLAVVHPLWSWRRLEAASGYMVRELEQFRQDEEVWRNTAEDPSRGDLVGRQLDLMDRAVASLRALRRLVSTALHGLPDAVLVLEETGQTVLANGQAATLFGPARGLDWPTLGRGWRSPGGAAFLLPADGGEAEAVSPDGRVWRVRAAGGADGYLIVRFTDVTEAHAAAEHRARLLAFLTHDMRAPQASILALTNNASPGTLSPDLAAQIRAYAGRTLGLADDFVQLARAQSDAYNMEPVNLADVALDAQDELWPQARGAGRLIEVIGEDGEWMVHGDRALLTRVVINLVDNALKYSEAGPVTCILSSAGDEMSLSVSDQGQGMTTDEIELAFQPFQRLSAAGRPKIKGAGLGLAFVRVVVQRHGGRIVCDSAPGRGTVIRLSFPAEEAAPSPELP